MPSSIKSSWSRNWTHVSCIYCIPGRFFTHWAPWEALYAEYIMRNAGLDESQDGIKIARKNINLGYADDTTLLAESLEEPNSLLIRVKEEWKSCLETQYKKTKIMASGPITSWQIEGEKVETVTDFIFLYSKITADGDCSHEIRRHLLLGRKAMTNLDSILKHRDITLPTKVHIVKLWFFQQSFTNVRFGP